MQIVKENWEMIVPSCVVCISSFSPWIKKFNSIRYNDFFSFFHCEVNDNLKLIWILTTSSDKNLYPVFSELYVGRTHPIKKIETFFDLIYNPNCANDKIRCTFVRSFLQLRKSDEQQRQRTTNDAISRKTRDEWDLNIWTFFWRLVNLSFLCCPNSFII